MLACKLLALAASLVLPGLAEAAQAFVGQGIAFDVGSGSLADLAIADFNADGFEDFAVVDGASADVWILFGGQGPSVASVDTIYYGPSAGASACAAADVTGDGVSDLVVAVSQSFPYTDEIRVYRGFPGGALTLHSTIWGGGLSPGSLAIADLNGDAVPDVVAACSNDLLTIALNVQSGATWTVTNYPTEGPGTSVDVIDAGTDGIPDIIESTYGIVGYFRNLGGGQFAARHDISTILTIKNIDAGDINGDGLVDIVATAYDGSIYGMIWGVAPDSFSAAVYVNIPTSDALITDLNGDARNDLILTSANGLSFEWNGFEENGVLVQFQQSDGTLATVWRGVSGNQPNKPTLADVDHDGRLDLVTLNTRSNSVSILPGNGDGSFGATRAAPADTLPYDLAVGDVNGDGIPDAVVAAWYTGRTSVLLGTGLGTFTSGTPVVAGNTTAAVLGDLTTDGVLDLVVADRATSLVTVLRGTGNGTFTAVGTLAAGAGPNGLALGDLNGDNRLDLVVSDLGDYAYGCDCYQQGDRLAILRGRGDGTFTPPVYLPTPQGPGAVALADMNGDGARDILVTTPGGFRGICLCWAGANKLSVYLNNGTGGFSGRIDRTVNTRPVGLDVADINGDGKRDVAIAQAGLWDGKSHVGSSVSVLLGNGNGTTTLDTTLTTGASPSSVVLADFTGDAVTDIAAANFVGNTVSFFQGIVPGTYAPKQDICTDSGPIALRAADLNADGRLDLLTANQFTYTVSVLMNQSAGPTAVGGGGAGGDDAFRVTATRTGRTFVFDIASSARETPRAEIYDLAGHRVRSLDVRAANDVTGFRAVWAGAGARDRFAPSGVYLLCVRAGARVTTVKIALVR